MVIACLLSMYNSLSIQQCYRVWFPQKSRTWAKMGEKALVALGFRPEVGLTVTHAVAARVSVPPCSASQAEAVLPAVVPGGPASGVQRGPGRPPGPTWRGRAGAGQVQQPLRGRPRRPEALPQAAGLRVPAGAAGECSARLSPAELGLTPANRRAPSRPRSPSSLRGERDRTALHCCPVDFQELRGRRAVSAKLLGW